MAIEEMPVVSAISKILNTALALKLDTNKGFQIETKWYTV